MDGPEKIAYYKKLKREKRNALSRAYYRKNKEEIRKKRKSKYAAQKNTVKKKTGRPSKEDILVEERKAKKRQQNAAYQAKLKEKKMLEEKKREKNRERVAKHRAKKKREFEQASSEKGKSQLKLSPAQRIAAIRTSKKVQNCLPKSTPEKAQIVKNLLQSEKRVRRTLIEDGVVHSPTKVRERKIYQACLDDIRCGVQSVKMAHSKDSRAAYHVATAMAFGEETGKIKGVSYLSKKLGINRNFALKKKGDRKNLHGNDRCWLVSHRRPRKDSLSEEVKNIVYKYWKNNSRPAGSKKNDMIKKRTGKSSYIHHARHLMEKTQHELYRDFVQDNPEVEISQRKFESMKPFYVKKPKSDDRLTCLCRQHVEMTMMLKSCMKFRKECKNGLPCYDHTSDIQAATLCPKQANGLYKSMCIERKCSDCGIKNLQLSDEETSRATTAKDVSWQRYEYIVHSTDSAGNEKRRIAIVDKITKPGEMFSYFLELLEKFPKHQFNAKWQKQQLDNLIENLPLDHAISVHDFSENYTLKHNHEIQSEYFSTPQATLHVSVVYRHAHKALDGEESSKEQPIIIKEYFIATSDDLQHDNHFVHHVRTSIAQYLSQNGVVISTMHEFTDGCSVQYKSRHCMGDISRSEQDLGFRTIRNFFETSHAKGEQDAAGGHCKTRADHAVVRNNKQFHSAKDLHDYLSADFSSPTSTTSSLARRVFIYIPSHGEGSVNRKRPNSSQIQGGGIRSWHSVQSLDQPGLISVRKRTCYCEACIYDEYEKCENKEFVELWEKKEVPATSVPVVSTRTQDHDKCEDLQCTVELQIDLVHQGSNIVIASHETDMRNDFYLFHVTSQGSTVLESNEIDDYGSEHLQGTNVFHGYFYELINAVDMIYSLNKEKKATVNAHTMRCVAPELVMKSFRGKSQCKLTPLQHMDILSALH